MRSEYDCQKEIKYTRNIARKDQLLKCNNDYHFGIDSGAASNSYPGEAYTLENGSLARARPALGLPAGTKGYLYCAAKDGHGWLTAQPAMRRARSSLTGCDSPSAARLTRFS